MSMPMRDHIAVIGAGNMGSGIAQKYAAEGAEVLLYDLDAASLQRGMDRIEAMLREGIERRVYRPAEADALRARLRPTTDWSELAGALLVIEAVFEDLEVKREVFRRAGEATGAETILATNTSSFLVRDLAGVVRYPERLLGLHYFYHPAKNRLVEVIPGPSTQAQALRRVWDLQEEIGKTPIRSADAPGFIVNRFFVPWINEAARMLDEGFASIATIEEAAKAAFGIGMGPFELMNVTGIPIGYHAAATLGRALGPFYEPATGLKARMEESRPYEVEGSPDPAQFARIADRLRGVVFHIAGAIVEEGVGSAEDVDIGARVGLRWPSGPFEMMNNAGIAVSVGMAGTIERAHALTTPAPLREASAAAHPFPLRLVDLEVEDGVATITIRRPDAMNALNETVVAQLGERLAEAEANAGVRGIVLAGSGKAFVAGADVRFFVRRIEEGRLDRVLGFTRAGQDLLRRIEEGPKPVVARLHGLALGGGLELALACDAIVATPRAVVAFPETGIGIYPGLGGTARTARRIGVPLTRWMVLTGKMCDAATCLAMGLVDDVVPYSGLRERLRERIEQGKRATGRLGAAPARVLPAGVPEPLRGAEAFFTTATLEEAVGSEAYGKALRGKAPLALREADRLIRGGAGLELRNALDLEFGSIETIFRTRDALEGLSSLGSRAPVFEGR
jgi:enoyl-CoA hydratase/3-hydroxyacyl-CoA dehydrogenase